LLFPSDNTVVVLARQRAFYPWWGWIRPLPVVIDEVAVAAPAAKLSMPPYDWTVVDPPKESALALVFDIVSGSTTNVEIPDGKTLSLDGAAAAEGLVIFGLGEQIVDWSQPESSRAHHAGILEVSDPANPVLRNPIALPGRLAAISELDSRGFLAWTESYGVSVSACDFQNAYLVSTLPASNGRALAVDSRSAFVALEKGVTAFHLADNATFRNSGTASLEWMPDSLRVLEGQLCAATYNRFAAVPVASFPSSVRQWNIATGLDLQNLIRLPADQFAAPAEDYGVEIFK
jgi:hypothetical protein